MKPFLLPTVKHYLLSLLCKNYSFIQTKAKLRVIYYIQVDLLLIIFYNKLSSFILLASLFLTTSLSFHFDLSFLLPPLFSSFSIFFFNLSLSFVLSFSLFTLTTSLSYFFSLFHHFSVFFLFFLSFFISFFHFFLLFFFQLTLVGT